MGLIPRYLLLTFLISGWSAYKMNETFSTFLPESRNSKLLFELNELDNPQITEIRYTKLYLFESKGLSRNMFYLETAWID